MQQVHFGEAEQDFDGQHDDCIYGNSETCYVVILFSKVYEIRLTLKRSLTISSIDALSLFFASYSSLYPILDEGALRTIRL